MTSGSRCAPSQDDKKGDKKKIGSPQESLELKGLELSRLGTTKAEGRNHWRPEHRAAGLHSGLRAPDLGISLAEGATGLVQLPGPRLTHEPESRLSKGLFSPQPQGCAEPLWGKGMDTE